MSRTHSWKLIAAVLMTAATALIAPAWARPFPHGGGLGHLGGPPDGPGGFGGMLHFGPLVEQLIFPCRNDCMQAERTCMEAAESAALTCATQTCDAQIQSARTDCAADRASQACLTDVSALITCVQPCLVTEAAALPTCAATYKACVGACSPTPTPTPQ